MGDLVLAALALREASRGSAQAPYRGAHWFLGQSGRTLGWIASLLYRIAPDRQRVEDQSRSDRVVVGGRHDELGRAHRLCAPRPQEAGTGRRRGERPRALPRGSGSSTTGCASAGGWNYGTPNELGTALLPYPEVTGIVLTALQDHAAATANQASLAALPRLLDGNESGVALAWALVCHALYDQPVSGLVQRLARSWARDAFLGGPRPMSVALLALTDRVAPVRIDHRA